ncbi:MAG: DUF374 domain-containing protein [Planctomycetota bacterium]|nr:MAG: DUF374 domain-containing protein [Planctomycetota bacterium]
MTNHLRWAEHPKQNTSMKIRNRRVIRFLARIMTAAFRLLFIFVRIEVRIAAPGICPYGSTGDQRFIYCAWHDGIAGLVFPLPGWKVAALVSQHADGSYVADTLEVIGIHPIRGSSRRGGAQAMRQMLEAAADYNIVIATDGPRGPRRTVKEGIVFLASQSGRPIVPVAFAARRAVRPRGRWTDLVIPLPFTKAYCGAGAPIHVPQGLPRNELGPYRVQLQQAMDDLQTYLDAVAEGREVKIPQPPEINWQPLRRAA